MSQSKRPNILFILADDLGWMDSTVYGSRYYETPHLERIAARGMTFTDAYAANPLCSPTRASLMTGKYPARIGITLPVCHQLPEPGKPVMGERDEPWHKVVTPESGRFLPLSEYTLGEAFRDAGYATGFIGKWHLGREEKYWPRNRGFDLDMGAFHPGPPSYFSPYKIPSIPDGPEGEYITDRITDEAIRYITQHRDEPFLLCLWQFAVHGPWQAKEEMKTKYRVKTDPRGKQHCPTMGAMIESMDDSIGRVLDHLDQLGIADNTIVVFVSDNGGNIHIERDGHPVTNNEPLRSGKANIHEGGVRVPCIIAWPGVVQPGARNSHPISTIDFYPTLLEMAGIAPKEGHLIDGESFVPLLTQTGTMKREAIFCHFPHYQPAVDNVPATSVRKGEWKLIRFYGEGENVSTTHTLYNLKDDLGETNDLSVHHPELVQQLSAMIDEHLRDIGGIVPFPNPDYDPAAPVPAR